MNADWAIQKSKELGEPAHTPLVISYSGGKTSALMMLLCWLAWSWRRRIRLVFANTGLEHEATLVYVRDFAAHHDLPVVWVEARFDKRKGRGVIARVVTFETAARKGEPYEEMCAKHGLANQDFPHCTRELKEYAIRAYLRSCNWRTGTYETAIGIRVDEFDRISEAAQQKRLVYPMIGLGIRKEDVIAWDVAHPVRLGIPEHYGNCITCWKKSDRKLLTVAREMPEAFDFQRRIEASYHSCGAGYGGRKIFRGHKTVADIFALAADTRIPSFVDGSNYADDLDIGAACGETCEMEPMTTLLLTTQAHPTAARASVDGTENL